MSLRPIKQIIQTKPTIEGAGVKLQRAFGFGKTKDFDPFLRVALRLRQSFRCQVPEGPSAGQRVFGAGRLKPQSFRPDRPEPVVVQISGFGPTDTHYFDAVNDPRSREKK
jgi:hypothetical protein